MANLSQMVSELQAQRRQARRELDRLDAAISALQRVDGGNGLGRNPGNRRPKRIMSIAARRKIAAAQRARWAAWKAKQKKAA